MVIDILENIYVKELTNNTQVEPTICQALFEFTCCIANAILMMFSTCTIGQNR